VAVKTANEVGLLADAFNQMGEEIQKSIEQIRQAAARNKELFMGSIRMLANAIDEKDPYTRGHSERVAFYSMLIAKHLGMSAEDVERVHLSGIIHDVGKIGIEDKILRKPAALTDEEYEIMKQHPRKGEHILEAVPLLKQLAGAGLMHHENVDGSGYPDGLKGEQIPLLGRIVSVADAFDAMTTDRPYSKAMTFEAALARLRFLAHKKFDDGCVSAIEKAAASGGPDAGEGAARVRDGTAPGRGERRRPVRTRRSVMRRLSRLAGVAALVAASLVARPSAAQGPPDAETSFNSGLQHLRENRPQMALEEFKRAVKLDDKSPYFQKGLGLAYSQLGKYDDAVIAFRRALQINPYYVDVRNDLGAALVLSGKRTEGRAEWIAAYNEPTNPTPDMSARNLGQSYLEEGNFQESANWFRSSLGKNPKQVDAYTGLAAALAGLQRPEEAVPVLEAALKDAPGETSCCWLSATCCIARAASTKRGRWLDEVIKKSPGSPEGRRASEMRSTSRADQRARGRRPRHHPKDTRTVALIPRPLQAGTVAHPRHPQRRRRRPPARRRPLEPADLDALEEALIAADMGLPACRRRWRCCARAAARWWRDGQDAMRTLLRGRAPEAAGATDLGRASSRAALGHLRGGGQRRGQDDDPRQARAPSTRAASRTTLLAGPPTPSAPRPPSSSRCGRSGPVAFHRGAEGADPSSCSRTALPCRAQPRLRRGVVDTAGRLHTKGKPDGRAGPKNVAGGGTRGAGRARTRPAGAGRDDRRQRDRAGARDQQGGRRSRASC
jgi:Tfp pilus assembly protein PilF